MTVPRLELQAAVAGSLLCDTIQSELGIDVSRRYFWIDSKVVKSWLETKEKLNAFVGPRIVIIQEKTKISEWNGLILATAYYLKMLDRLQMKTQDKPTDFKIDVNDMTRAKNLWYRKVQLEVFLPEHHDIKKTGYVRAHSRLRTFSPFLHDGVIRMSGRMPDALSFEENNPIILPSKHPFTELLIKSYHEAYLHVGVNTVVNSLRKKFRILKCRAAVKRIFNDCYVCKQKKIKTSKVKMAPLHYQRTNPNVYPFTYVGIDYFGPILVKHGRKLEKHWICLFSCLSTRAIHMEIVPSLTTNSCIMAIMRFMNIRGISREIIADNGTYFVGTKNEIGQLVKELDNDEIS